MPVERARRTGEREAREARSDGSADGRVEPKLPAASLAGIPFGDNLLGIREGLAFGLGVRCRFRGARGSALALLRSAVRAHGGRLAAAVSQPARCSLRRLRSRAAAEFICSKSPIRRPTIGAEAAG